MIALLSSPARCPGKSFMLCVLSEEIGLQVASALPPATMKFRDASPNFDELLQLSRRLDANQS